MTKRTFLTPTELGQIKLKAKRLSALWTGWAEFLATEVTEPIVYQLTDPSQGKIAPDDLSLVVSVFNTLKEASGQNPVRLHDWDSALASYKFRRNMREAGLEDAFG